MHTHPTWGGVDWYGCDDDLVWEPLDGSSDSAADGAHLADRLRRVLILDVENICPGSRRPARALARLDAVLQAAGPVDRIIAASAASQHSRLDRLLRRAGVHIHTKCRNRPNAADRALVQAARQFARDGDCEVVVASNDHSFRVIADLPGVRRLVLITVPHLATARALIRSADEHRVVAA
jgi:hypothetical protein